MRCMDHLPSDSDILAWIEKNPEKASKRDIAKAFRLKGQQRIDLKQQLKRLTDQGHIHKQKNTYAQANSLPPVCVLQVQGADKDGDLWATPLKWDGTTEPPKIYISQGPAARRTLGENDRVLARIKPMIGEPNSFIGKVIHVLGAQQPNAVLGIYHSATKGGWIEPIDKKDNTRLQVAAGATQGAQEGDLVAARKTASNRQYATVQAQIEHIYGNIFAPKALSLIAIKQHQIPDVFSPQALCEAKQAHWQSDPLREDLTHLPLLTIDPPNARDHDDACCALPDTDKSNKGGFIIWIAIADVAHFVTADSALDEAAQERGNSTYFPDSVLPMLPETLSADLCSLRADELRPCLAVKVKINAEGEKIFHQFYRAQMRSAAALTYTQVQTAMDSAQDAGAPPFAPTLRPLFAAFDALYHARLKRQPLNLELPEREIMLADNGTVAQVRLKQRLKAHMVIEELMILANVCAAQTLIEKDAALIIRSHPPPDPLKIKELAKIASASGFGFPKTGNVTTRQLNQLLSKAAQSDTQTLINMTVLRMMEKAHYTPQHKGHFGLALRRYVHFTSPIRRYADLLVHRALYAAHGWEDAAQKKPNPKELEQICEHISLTERRSMQAERDTADRYLALYMAEQVGCEFEARISHVARFGLFIELDKNGANGFVPIRTIADEYFHHDADEQCLTGEKSGLKLTIGQNVTVKLREATPHTGELTFDLLTIEGTPIASPKGRNLRHKGRRYGPRKGKRKIRRERK